MIIPRCKMAIRMQIGIAIFILSIHLAKGDDLWDTYSQCRPTLGKASWLCDPYGKLKSKEAKDRLDNSLWRLQTDVPCYCPTHSECFRYASVPIESGVTGALVVTTHLPGDATATIQRIYDDAKLAASSTCDNGLLIIYAMDDKKLHVTRGGLIEQMFFSSDADSILNRTSEVLQAQDYDDALPALVEQYVSRLQRDTYDRQRNWETIVGVVVAAAVGVFAAAVLGGVCCARYCAKKKSLSSPPSPPMFKKEQVKTQSALRRVRRKRNKVAAREKRLADSSRTISGRPVSPKRLTSAKRRVFRKQNRKQRKTLEEEKKQAALLPQSSGSEDQYYLISEPPSTIYGPYSPPAGTESPYATGTLRPMGSSGHQSPSAGPQPPAILYPDSQAVFSHSPSPKRETQRRDTYFDEGV